MTRFLSLFLVFSILALFPRTAPCINPHATLADLKKLEILCYVPGWLPKGFKLKSVAITYDEPGPDENSVGRFPLYYLEYGDNHGGSFTIDSAREGIGDRNLMETEDSEETTITSPFGPMYLIYTPKTASSGSGRLDDIKSHPQGELRGETKFVKGQGNTASSGSGRIDDIKGHPQSEIRGATKFVKGGRKKEIKANWARDANMKAENAKALVHPILGRYHGFSSTGLSLSEFEKIVTSLHPIRD